MANWFLDIFKPVADWMLHLARTDSDFSYSDFLEVQRTHAQLSRRDNQ